MPEIDLLDRALVPRGTVARFHRGVPCLDLAHGRQGHQVLHEHPRDADRRDPLVELGSAITFESTADQKFVKAIEPTEPARFGNRNEHGMYRTADR